MKKRHLWIVLLCAFTGSGCTAPRSAPPAAEADHVLGAGFRYSVYGPEYDPGPSYWADVGKRMAARFPGATPEAIWIVGRLKGEGTELSFPAETKHPLIQFTEEDGNEEALTLFDRSGFRVWLQVEPGNAPVDELIHLMLDRYGHHACVVGVGVDVESYRSIDKPEGQAVTDAEATAWLQAARSHGQHYRLFLKHWEIGKMPPTVRDGLFFVDDSQIFPSLDAMVEEFAEWGRAFFPASVGFQFGYESDQPWWEKLDDPASDIGWRIVTAVPNAQGLYWVDFTVLQVFPPKKSTAAGPDPMVGVKLYEYEGSFNDLIAEWATLGINTAFVSETLAAQTAFRDLAGKHGIATLHRHLRDRPGLLRSRSPRARPRSFRRHRRRHPCRGRLGTVRLPFAAGGSRAASRGDRRAGSPAASGRNQPRFHPSLRLLGERRSRDPRREPSEQLLLPALRGRVHRGEESRRS